MYHWTFKNLVSRVLNDVWIISKTGFAHVKVIVGVSFSGSLVIHSMWSIFWVLRTPSIVRKCLSRPWTSCSLGHPNVSKPQKYWNFFLSSIYKGQSTLPTNLGDLCQCHNIASTYQPPIILVCPFNYKYWMRISGILQATTISRTLFLWGRCWSPVEDAGSLIYRTATHRTTSAKWWRTWKHYARLRRLSLSFNKSRSKLFLII